MKRSNVLLIMMMSMQCMFPCYGMEMPENSSANRNLLNAAREGDSAGIVAALNGGADVMVQDDTYFATRDDNKKRLWLTPLHYAVQNGNTDDVLTLVEHARQKFTEREFKEFINRPAVSGISPLHHAAGKNNVEMTELLLVLGAQVNALDYYGANALYGNNNPEIVERLLFHGADRNHRNSDGMTPLHVAAELGYHEVIPLLITPENIDMRDVNGLAPLHYAIGNPRAVRALLERGANVNIAIEAEQPDGLHVNGQTPLHGAALTNDLESAIILMNFRGAFDMHDQQGNTPESLARQAGHEEIAGAMGRRRRLQRNNHNLTLYRNRHAEHAVEITPFNLPIEIWS